MEHDDELNEDELIVLEQALQNPRTSVILNDWLDKKLDEKLGVLDAKWEQRFKELDAKWELRFKEMDAKWELRFEKLDSKWELRFKELEDKLDKRLNIVEMLKEQNRSQEEKLTKLQNQFDAKNDEIIALLRQIGLDRK
jgi:hypothetical protein